MTTRAEEKQRAANEGAPGEGQKRRAALAGKKRSHLVENKLLADYDNTAATIDAIVDGRDEPAQELSEQSDSPPDPKRFGSKECDTKSVPPINDQNQDTSDRPADKNSDDILTSPHAFAQNGPDMGEKPNSGADGMSSLCHDFENIVLRSGEDALLRVEELAAAVLPVVTQPLRSALLTVLIKVQKEPPCGLAAKEHFVATYNRMLDGLNLRIDDGIGPCRLTCVGRSIQLVGPHPTSGRTASRAFRGVKDLGLKPVPSPHRVTVSEAAPRRSA